MTDFLQDDAIMPATIADTLALAYLDGAERYETNHAHEFWNGRLLAYRDAPYPIAQLMLRFLELATWRVRNFYGVREPLYADVLHLVGWPEGIEMPVHADNCERDGSSNGLAHRAYSGVYYLTDGHKGGRLNLPRQGLSIAPKRGRFVSLPCGVSHEHGVERVATGLRVTMAFFLTRDRDKADPALVLDR